MNPQEPTPENQTPAQQRNPDMNSTLPPGADAEERFNEFWRQNGTSIFVAIAIGAVLVIGMQTWKYVQARHEEKVETAYAAADSSDKLISFAVENKNHRLAGAAYLKVANSEYAAGQYLQAGEHYSAAREKLAGSPFYERAALGVAMSEMMNGKIEQGVSDLTSVMNTPEFLELTRAEAAFNLGLHYLKVQDYKALTSVCDIADTFGEKNMYAEMTRRMRDQIPLETK